MLSNIYAEKTILVSFIKTWQGDPALLSQGGIATFPFLVSIAVTMMNDMTVLVSNALYRHLTRGDIERAYGAYCHASRIGACLLARYHNRLDDIPCLEALHLPGLPGSGTREAVPIHPAHLPRAMPSCLDYQRHDVRDMQHIGSACSDTCRVKPVGLGEVARGAIVFGSPTCSALHRYTTLFETFIQCPSRRIDCRCIFERLLRLSEKTLQHIRLAG